MRRVSANKSGCATKPRTDEQAQVRIVILALASFLLGVAVTAGWFHLTTQRIAPVQSSQTPVPSEQQSAEPPSGAKLSPQKFVEQPVPVPPSAVDEVKSVLPNYSALSLEQGTEILRQAALRKYAAATQELQSQVAQAQDELSQAEGQSPAARLAAIKNLQQVQAEQSRKLQQIGAQLQTQIAALKQLKGTTP